MKTREQIQAMPAGLEMDALVCEAFGLEMVGTWRPTVSTEIDAAWLLVERLAEQGMRLTLEDRRDDDRPAVAGWLAILTFPDGHDTGQVLAPTVPLAVCRVALVAIRSKL